MKCPFCEESPLVADEIVGHVQAEHPRISEILMGEGLLPYVAQQQLDLARRSR